MNGAVVRHSVVIGACGHRKLENGPILGARVREAIGLVKGKLPALKNTPVDLCVLSPLAEGADRLIAREVLEVPGASLTAVLPLEKDDYMSDFAAAGSGDEFTDLLSRADDVVVLPHRDNRIDAYEKAGQYTVDQCDVLFVIWDGKAGAGRGGTEDMVRYARGLRRPLVWIQANGQAGLTVEWGEGLDRQMFEDVESYNAEHIPDVAMEDGFEKQYGFFVSRAEQSGLAPADLESAFKYLLRYYVRADALASRYQRLHFGSDSLVTMLALFAVITAAFQIIFIPEYPSVLLLEILLMLVVLGVVAVGRQQGWHRKWMDYRYLAERLRLALFMSLTENDVLTQRRTRHGTAGGSSGEWIIAAFLSIWNGRPRVFPACALSFGALNRFISTAWIEDQMHYHDRAAGKLHRRHFRMSAAGYVIFALTVCAAVLHILQLGPPFMEISLAFAAIVFPAVAASITAIRIQRDYLRKSLRSKEMARRLAEVKDRFLQAGGCNEFLGLLKEIDEIMLVESEDWRDLVWLHKPEVPV